MHSAWAYLLAKQALYQLSYGPPVNLGSDLQKHLLLTDG